LLLILAFKVIVETHWSKVEFNCRRLCFESFCTL